MRAFTATLGTETNTFSPMPTGMRNFEQTMLLRPGEHPEHVTEVTAPLWATRRRGEALGWTVIEGTCAFAMPAGRTVRRVYEALRDEILEQLRDALPLDLVALGMHGAMVADGYDDCEGDFLVRVREIVGPKTAVGIEIDPHCHVTEAMVANTDAIICFKEYPHTDYRERAGELLDILSGTAEGKLRPRISVHDCGMLATYPTTREPMKGFLERLRQLEQEEGVLSISIAHGFPWGDVPDVGTKVIVVTHDAAAKGDALARQLGREIFGLRTRVAPKFQTIEAGLDDALEGDGPVVVADTADNPGGGAPGDSTFLLHELLRRGVQDACYAPIWDPVAVGLCFEAGEGATLALRIGGKMGPTSGDPLDLTGRVTKLAADAQQTFDGNPSPLGDAAAFEVEGVHIVLISTRDQAFGTDLFTNLGIDPATKRLVVVKSSQHFYAGFGPIAKRVVYINGPGALQADFTKLPYRNLRRRLWPMVDDPFAEPGGVG